MPPGRLSCWAAVRPPYVGKSLKGSGAVCVRRKDSFCVNANISQLVFPHQPAPRESEMLLLFLLEGIRVMRPNLGRLLGGVDLSHFKYPTCIRPQEKRAFRENLVAQRQKPRPAGPEPTLLSPALGCHAEMCGSGPCNPHQRQQEVAPAVLTLRGLTLWQLNAG